MKSKKMKEVETSQPRRSRFARGEAGMQADKKWEEESRKSKKFTRHYMRPGQERVVCFLDDALAFFKEHSGKIRGKLYNKTCLDQSLDEDGNGQICPYCENDQKVDSMYIAGTIIDFTGFQDQDTGRRVRFYKKPFILKKAAKAEFFEQRKKLIKKRGSEEPLKLTVWNVRRSKNDKSPNTGEIFTFKKAFASKKELKDYLVEKGVQKDDWKEFLSPIDYEEAFAAETEEQARRFLGVQDHDRPGARKGDDFGDDDFDEDETTIEDEIDY